MTFTKDDFKRVLWTFVQAAVGAIVVGLTVEDQLPQSFDEAKQVALVLGAAALAAGISAIKNLLLNPGDPLK